MDEMNGLLRAYAAASEEAWISLALFAVGGVLAGWGMWRLLPWLTDRLEAWMGKRARGVVPLAVLLVVLGFGLVQVADEVSCFDDAFIFLRYSWNLAEGHGLVFNLGEYVEGYTNFLWTLMIGAVMWATNWDGPLIAMGACALAYVANVLVIARLGATLRPSRTTVYVPLAAMAFALQPLSVAYGTSGLETQFASLLVNLGILFLATADGRQRLLGAGAWFIMATLARPDHGLYFAIGGLVLLLEAAHRIFQATAPERKSTLEKEALDLLSYSAPFAVYLAYLGWKTSYYGSVVPNTYYAKSANLTYFSQGWLYVSEFYLSHHVWLGVIALFLISSARWAGPSSRFVPFSLLSVVLYTYYVAKVGGDFMEGRFLFTLLPLALLGLEQVFYRALAGRKDGRRPLHIAGATLSVAALVLCTQSVDLIGGRSIKWGIAHESRHYAVESFSPFRIGHFNFQVGKILQKLTEAGHAPRVALKTVGMPAYYGRGYVLDRRGLTDAHVAHLPLEKRARPGHEKLADMPYVESRKVHFIDSLEGPDWLLGQSQLRFPGVPRGLSILTYDNALMNALGELVPGAKFVPAERALDRYIQELRIRTPATVKKHLAWLRGYYFDHNDDPKRLRILEAYAGGDRSVAPAPKRTTAPNAGESVTVAFAGDAILARTVNTRVTRHGVRWPLENVRHLIAPVDLALVNLECVLASSGEQHHLSEFSKAYLRGRPEMVQVLTAAGFDVASLANNHGGDYGPDALVESVSILQKAGLDAAGAGSNSEEASRATFRRVGPYVVGILGVQTLVSQSRAKSGRAGTNYLSLSDLDGAIESLTEQVVKARQNADIVLLMIHWGPNNRERPNEIHREFAKRAVREAGIDALLGTSAHMLQGIEVIDGRPIIYDAGNLILDWSASRRWTHHSAIFHLQLDDRGVRSVIANPILLHYGRAVPAPKKDAERTLERLKILSEEMATSLNLEDGRAVLSLHRPDPAPAPLQRWSGAEKKPVARKALRRLVRKARKKAKKHAVVPHLPKQAQKLDVAFRDGPTLRGFELPEKTKMSLGINPVTYWSTDEKLRGPHEIYFEVVPQGGGKSERAWTGDEHEPADWMLPTAWWEPGEIVRDLYHIKSREKLDEPRAHDVYVGIQKGSRKLPPLDSSRKRRGNAVFLGTVELR